MNQILQSLIFRRIQSILENYKPHTLVICLGALFLPFIYVDLLLDKSVLPKYLFICLISLIAYILWYKEVIRKQTFKFNNIFYIFIILYVFALCSIGWSEYIGTYYSEIIYSSSFLIVLFISTQISHPKEINIILFCSITGGLIAVLITFLQLWGWNPFLYVTHSFPAASFINKNHLANYIDLLIPICFAMLLTAKKISFKYFFALSLTFFYSYLIVSHTRASWLSLLIVLFIILYFFKRFIFLSTKHTRVSPQIVIFIILFSSILIFTSHNKNNINEAQRFASLYSSDLGEKTSSNSVSTRIHGYIAAINMIKDKPIAGVGLGSFYISFKPYYFKQKKGTNISTFLLQLHNDSLQVFIELGILGGALFLLLIVMIFHSSYQYLSTSSNKHIEVNILYMGLLLSLINSAVHSLLSFPLHQPASSYLIFIFIGLLLNKNAKNINSSYTTVIIKPILFVVVAYFSFNLYYSYISSSYYINQSIKSIYNFSAAGVPTHIKEKKLMKKNCEAAVKYAGKSLDIFKSDFNTHGWIYTIYSECKVASSEKITIAKKILKQDPNHFAYLEMLASIYFEEKQFHKAKAHVYHLHQLYTRNSRYTLWLGHIAAKTKKYQEALYYYKKTLEIDPANYAAKKMILTLIKTI